MGTDSVDLPRSQKSVPGWLSLQSEVGRVIMRFPVHGGHTGG